VLCIGYREATFQNKLMENVNRIWFERGEWKNISGEVLEESVARKRAREDGNELPSSPEDSLPAPIALQPTAESKRNAMQQFPDAQKLRESVVGKLK
jgi:hypothetical protein